MVLWLGLHFFHLAGEQQHRELIKHTSTSFAVPSRGHCGLPKQVVTAAGVPCPWGSSASLGELAVREGAEVKDPRTALTKRWWLPQPQAVVGNSEAARTLLPTVVIWPAVQLLLDSHLPGLFPIPSFWNYPPNKVSETSCSSQTLPSEGNANLRLTEKRIWRHNNYYNSSLQSGSDTEKWQRGKNAKATGSEL